MTHIYNLYICTSKLIIIDSDNGLSPGQCQAIIWTNKGILFNGPLETHLSEILSKIPTFFFKKINWKILSVKWRPFSLSLNVSNHIQPESMTKWIVIFPQAIIAIFVSPISHAACID